MDEKVICVDNLLELLLRIGDIDSEESILENFIPAFCQSSQSKNAFVLKKKNITNFYENVFQFPKERLNGLTEDVQKKCIKKISLAQNSYCHCTFKDLLFKIFPMHTFGFLVIENNAELNKNTINKLSLITNHLGKILLLAKEKTQRQEIEDLLNKREQFQHLSLEINHASVFENNFETGKVSSTPHLYYYLGYSDEDLPQNISDTTKFIHPDDLQMVLNHLYDHFDGNSPEYYAEFRMKSKSDEWVWVNGRGKATQRNEEGKPVTLLGISQVITKRKQAELDLIKAKEKAEESDKLKSAFLANMSHEIRTPLNGILGFTEILKDPYLEQELRIKYIDLIEKSGYRMLNIINDLIDISKIESGQMEIQLSKVNIINVVNYIYNFFKPEVLKNQMDFIIDVPAEDSNKTITTDLEKVYAIFSNLVKNAIKYSTKGSITIGYKYEEHFIVYFVKDTGLGIQESMIEKVFDRFVQSKDVRKIKVEGAGLGLSICKAYVEMLGGNIWVESKLTEGSTFYFTIPIMD